MQDSFYNGFLKNWDKFISRLKGEIMMQANKGVFTFSYINLILADCTGFWDSSHSEGGRWLIELEKAFPDKAELVRTILLNDMRFSEESGNIQKNNILRYAVPIGSAVVGFSLSNMMGASKIVKAICTIAPAAVTVPITNNILSGMDDSRTKSIINRYISQLEKYRISIESILEGI
ncbi:MAG: hypothetical protein J1F64_02665 [Oscillospiraceae bacterium]|nr:hypothetical protein [Oscillospiraceae bacterium]